MDKNFLKINSTVIDSHCHLDMIKLDSSAVIENALNHGVDFMVTICTELADVEKIVSLSKKYKNVFVTFGIHPEHAETEMLSPEDIISYAESMKAIGIGETGLDYHYNPASKQAQEESFKNHIIAASKLNIPLIIHSREAEDETIAILEEMKKQYDFKTVLHCFSSNIKLAEFAIQNDMYISASGIVTFNKSEKIQKIFKKVPKNLLLVETDAPFLAPVPFRGKECEPAMVTQTVQKLAELHNISTEEMAEITTQNFKTLFKNIIPS
ncbi:MAG: TatD family hydrolase [Proteobacteria bacterium]|nr:TatD family hydrolase [Pseudomonadota bacterium]